MKVVVLSRSPGANRGHGNAHFLRGVATELQQRGHEVGIVDPTDGWSRSSLDLELDDADLVLVQESIPAELVEWVGAHRARTGGYRLLFHDTHRHAHTVPEELERFDLSGYDGVLAGGEAIRQTYLECDWAGQAWTWHEAADTRVFRPSPAIEPEADLVWIGDWGGGERSKELRRFLLCPARQSRVRGSVYGANYPRTAKLRARLSGLHYRGCVAYNRIPELFAQHRLTVHIPHRPDAEALPGTPTIRPFEAMACGIPLICSPWDDAEGLFRAEQDYLVARDTKEMREAMQAILEFPELAEKLRTSGLETIHARHTCAHRADELLTIDAELRGVPALEATG